MHESVIGIFPNYGAAEAAVRDLELAGIVGGQVEIIGNAEADDRTAGWLEKSRNSKKTRSEPVQDDSGDQPDYIGRQEFYATHVREGHTVVIVRGSSATAERAKSILNSHGAVSPSGDSGASELTENDTPRSVPGARGATS